MMAGDWIKMRGNLWDDPRVAKMCDETGASEATIVGGLYWLWASADQHSENGIMPGLTTRAIDRKSGVAGFAESLILVGWLADHPEGVRIVRFEEHNGKSAKRRCSESVRKMSARDADTMRTKSGHDADVLQQSCAPREREEIDNKKQDQKQKQRAPRFDAQAHLVGIGVDSSIASDWITHRKAKKALITSRVIDAIDREAKTAGMALADVLEACCQRGWTGFKAEWVIDKPKTPTYAEQKQINDSATLRALGLRRSSFSTPFDFIEGEKA